MAERFALIEFQTVRRFLVLLLLLLTAAQLTWAAAARYCTHEGAQAAHFGHHAHVHKPAAADHAADMTPAASGEDIDCGACHLGCGLAAPADLPAAQPPAIEGFTGAVPPRLAEREPPGVDRPNWVAAS